MKKERKKIVIRVFNIKYTRADIEGVLCEKRPGLVGNDLREKTDEVITILNAVNYLEKRAGKGFLDPHEIIKEFGGKGLKDKNLVVAVELINNHRKEINKATRDRVTAECGLVNKKIVVIDNVIHVVFK